VDLLPNGTPFDSVEIKYKDNDASASGNSFTASLEGWAVFLYRDQEADDPDEKEKFDVVRTLVWNHPDNPDDSSDRKFPIEANAIIGKDLSDGEHDGNNCGESGYVLFENAPYDGAGENSAYDRSTGTGPIFPVNRDLTGPFKDAQTDPLDDLVVVWYQTSSNSGVCWPSKPVRYDTVWPDPAPKIVIASGLGSGPLPPAQYGPVEDILIYIQPDRGQPGYNDNEEHAAFFTAQGSQDPAVFALRNDLNRDDTSEAYVLLKYINPDDGEWTFKVFEVVAQSASYERDASGQVQENNATQNRYDIDDSGVLLERSDAPPEPSYYIGVNGRLRNESDNECYNLTGSGIVSVSCLSDDVKYYYIDENGDLQEQTASLPTALYALDRHGVLVDSTNYYRFHYTETAGQEINPPYPLNQQTFGPCPESYTSTPESVLDDKAGKFFAKNGGFNGKLTEDVIVNYFYRLQPGFYYDLDSSGVNDKPVSTCVALLGRPDGISEGYPVDTIYSVRWPDTVPTLHVGETLIDAMTQEGEPVGLPNVGDQCIVHVLFDQSIAETGGPDDPNANPAVNLIDPLHEHSEPWKLDNPEKDLPQSMKPEFSLEPAVGVRCPAAAP